MSIPSTWHSPHRPHPKALLTMGPSTAGAMRWAGRAIGAFSLAAFVLLSFRQGVPASLEQEGWETPAQLSLLLVLALAYAIAWWRESVGSAGLIVCGVTLGVFATIAYAPATALLAALAFVVPGVLLALHWQWHAGPLRLGVMVASVAVVLAGGGYASGAVWDHYYGPTHPSSDTELPPVDLVRWAWSGAVTGESFVVIAELVGGPATAALQVAEADDLAGAELVPGVAVEGTGRSIVRFEVDGLEPGVEYHWAVASEGELDTGRRGAVTTFPRGPASFTFAVGSCLRTGSDGLVFDRIREADPLFMLIPGDFTYENLRSTDPERFLDSYVANLTSEPQEALYLQAPVVYSWDDHDYGGNNADGTSTSREAAREAYADFVPHYPLPDAGGAIYHSFSVGRVLFVVTDTRSERLPDGVEGGPTMLGAGQLAWLKGELLRGERDFELTIWSNGVPWVAPAVPGADNWGGYAAEREEIANFIAANGIDSLAMVSGDAHMVAIDDGSNSDYATVGGDAGFPVLHAAALDRRGSVKGGPYSEGAIPGGGQFALVTVEDDGGTLRVTFSARDWRGDELLHYEFEVDGGRGVRGVG
jgi:phosphodiesterase/alkaline phosphatase D-like protein